MRNLHIYFAYPWLLLLLVLAVVFTLIPHLKLRKRYRRTRNRITSIVLHLIVMVLAITTLAGIEFRYQIPNEENQIVLLVDVSDTEEASQEQRDSLVETILDYGSHDAFQIGVVTFGFDQQYAVPFTYDIDSIYEQYLNAEKPDTSATNIEGALEYAKSLFNNPQTGKIVLITDGKETDGTATSVIKAVSAQGTKVDVAYVGSNYDGVDAQIIGVTLPEHHVNVGEECPISLTVQSDAVMSATITLIDGGKDTPIETSQEFNLIEGPQNLTFKHTFTWDGLHELQFKVEADNDALGSNDTYTSYAYLEVYKNVLILEREAGESEKLAEMLNEGLTTPYNITIKGIQADDVPMTTDELRMYDQVILNNIANADMKDGFDVVLESYVSEYGGGLFTVGGNDELGNANAYNRADMNNTLYQQMLPVQAINYTPPVGVMIVIDRSGSMDSPDEYGDIKFDSAKAGTAACLQAMSERDYLGIMTLDDAQELILPLTSRTKEAEILEAINSLEKADGNTVFPDAIFAAGQHLRTAKQVEKRHIVIITDGAVGEDQREIYEPYIDSFYKTDGITLSIIAIGLSERDPYYQQMLDAVELGHGRLHAVKNTAQLVNSLRDDLNAPEITEVVEETFNPRIANSASTSPLVQGLDRLEEESVNKLAFTLDGFYGVKARAAAELILVGDYDVPIYAQWQYGKGMVGSFMSDLSGNWSADFMANESAVKFTQRVINNLMPVENIRPSQIRFELKEDNYTNQISIYTDLKEGETIQGELIQYVDGKEVKVSLNEVTPGDNVALREMDCYVTSPLSAANNYSRCHFVVKGSGVYKIVLKKCDAEGNVLVVNGKQVVAETYKSFAYSDEYNTFEELTEDGIPVDTRAEMEQLAERGNGTMVADLEDPFEIFEDFVTELDKTFDPRILFMILAIVLFLADIAVRKFKFKWPHELIREYKEKKNSK